MCFKKECNKCGKTGWAGCGKHLASIYANIEKGKHCMCNDWPGVVIEKEATTTGSSSTNGNNSILY
ncbi:hypothetical protein ACHQM5_016953 [Ranunculus cassubicifolius]